MKTLSAVSLGVAALLVFGNASSARAQDADREPASLFEKLDANDDGKLSKEEFQSSLKEDQPQKRTSDSPGRGRFARDREFDPKQFFERMDQNKDGKLSLNEFPEPMQPRMKSLFERAGKDALTPEDFARVMAARSRQSEGRDRPDADGKRRPEESDRPRSKGDRDRREAEGDRRDRRPDDRGREGRPPEGFGGPAFFRILDQNRDGRLSKEELEKAAEKLMELDRNKDGSLEPRELFGDGPQGFRGPRGPRGPFGPRPGFDPPFRRPGEGDRPDDARPGRRDSDDASRDRKRPDGSVQKPREDSRRGSNRDSIFGEGTPRWFPNYLFKKSDSNSDGKLSRDETPERMRERFSQLDADNDGSLTLEELKRGFGHREDRGFRGKRPDDQPREKDGE